MFYIVEFSYNLVGAFVHYGYGAKTERTICVRLPPLVQLRFANCGGVVPQQMRSEDMCRGDPILDSPLRTTHIETSSQSVIQNEVTGEVVISQRRGQPIGGRGNIPKKGLTYLKEMTLHIGPAVLLRQIPQDLGHCVSNGC